jgi:hypothetical protein
MVLVFPLLCSSMSLELPSRVQSMSEAAMAAQCPSAPLHEHRKSHPGPLGSVQKEPQPLRAGEVDVPAGSGELTPMGSGDGDGGQWTSWTFWRITVDKRAPRPSESRTPFPCKKEVGVSL